MNFHLTPTQKRNINKILPFGIIFFIFGVIWSLIVRSLLGELDHYPADPRMKYDFINSILTVSFGSLIWGWIFGSIEILFINKLFVKRSFGFKILVKTIIYVIILCIILISFAFVIISTTRKISLFDPIVIKAIAIFFTTFSFWVVIIYMSAVIGILLFFSEVSDNLGQSVLKNFLIGKYHKPREEERIFMFLDMKSSTTIAEKLGHVHYYKLLNDFYTDITKAIIQTSGEIYQYVGDEIVVSWKLKDGLKNNNCLRCFFTIKEIFNGASEKYIKEFGLVPEFKAGLHYGKVTTGEIGVVKKEIIFTGDVLNTTARIQSSCNTYDVDILISNDLVHNLQTVNEFIVIEIGECELRGKDEKVKLQTVKKI